MDVERALFAYSHEMVDAALLEYWNYPQTIVNSTLYHHDFEGFRDKDVEVFSLCAIINLASAFCRYYGIGRLEPDRDIDFSYDKGAIALEAKLIVIDEMLERFQPEFVKERNLFLS